MKSFLAALLLSASAWSMDPLFSQQWALSNNGQSIYRADGDIKRELSVGVPGTDINWPGLEALSLMNPSAEVIVAVIDHGVDLSHPELKGRLYEGKDFLDGAPMVDDQGHGTHVAGIIAANANGEGMQGVTPSQIKILPLKVLNKEVQGFVYKGKVITDVIANAIAYAIDAKASVINMSLGWPQIINTPKITKTLDAAAEKGIVLVAASGNNNKDVPVWPCSHPAVICVGAIDNQGKISEFSNHGGKVDLVAPGEWIISTIPMGLESRTLRISGYEAKNGSSQAAPFVAAAAALLKLQDPTLTAQEIKAKLYLSAKPLKQSDSTRFVRFGALSIADALQTKARSMALLSVKDLVTVPVNEDGNFSFKLPLEILGKTNSSPEIKLHGLEAQIHVSGNTVSFSGHLPDLTIDSEMKVSFEATLDGHTTITSTTLSFARSLSLKDLRNVSIPQLTINQLMATQGAMKTSRLSQVLVIDRPSHDFHGYISSKKDDTVVVTSIRANSVESLTKNTQITLTDFGKLLSVMEKDVNLDGKNDLVFYGMNPKQTHLLLHFTTLDGAPLFAQNSRWELPITTFEGLPLKDGDKADFSWIKVSTVLGEIAVPHYQKPWLFPEEDNSKRLTDHVDEGMDLHQYYWEPVLENNKIIVRPRIIDSVSFTKSLRKSLGLSARQTLKVEFILPQSLLESQNGSVRHLISYGMGFDRKFSIVSFKDNKTFTHAPHMDQDAYQGGSNSLKTRSLEDFSVVKNSFLFTLLDRSSARVKPLSEGIALDAWNLQTSGWNNPFFEVVSTFEGQDRKTLFFESRYHVYVYDQEGSSAPVIKKLPINRDSSFPGVDFSETLQAGIVKTHAGPQPAVTVNSTLIYGDRLYSMVSNGSQLTRPIALSVSIPKSCVPLKTQSLSASQGSSAYALICQTTTGPVISFFPLEIH
jgi:cell wall-associated protease